MSQGGLPTRAPVHAGDWRYQAAPGQAPWRPAHEPAALVPSSPLVYRHVKVAPREVPRVLAEMAKPVRREFLIYHLLFAVLLAASLGSVALLSEPPLGIFGALVLLVLFVQRRRRIARKAAKLEFLRALLGLLADELHPRAPVRFDFDLTAYDAAGKLFRTASSAAGNKKSYYSDKWLRLRVRLADGTQVEVVRQQGLKEKKGFIVVEKRRMFITLTPVAKRYRPMLGERSQKRLSGQVTQEILDGLWNPPELLRVHVESHSADISLKLVQEDVDILPSEVIVILHGTLKHLQDRCLVPRAQG